MSKAKELLLECKIKLGVKTDYKLAQALQIDRARISDYMAEKRTPDAFACVQMALILQRDPAEIIAIIESESEKNEKRKTFWLDFLRRVEKASRAGTLGLIFIVSLLGGQQNLKPEAGFFRRQQFA